MCNEKTFEELVNLFKEDPSGFDNYKQEQIENRITQICSDCPEKVERCKQFQWRIDQELAKYKNPIMRYNAMVEMFWSQVDEFKQINRKPAKPTTTASILDFGQKG